MAVASEEDSISIGYDTESHSSQVVHNETRGEVFASKMKTSRSFCDQDEPWAVFHDEHHHHPLSHSSSYRLGDLGPYVLEKLGKGEAELQLCSEGQGGTYFVMPTINAATRRRPSSGSGPKNPPPAAVYPIAVWKPADEEIGMAGNPRGNTVVDRTGFVAGEGYKHEVLAWRLDYEHFANVPETVVATIGGKVGSLQRFIPSRPSYDFGPRRFDVSAVHRIGIFDIRTLNGDRHDGNMLVPHADGSMLIPIDHSYILPNGFADPDQLDWMQWEQSRVPFSASELRYIASLDADRDRGVVAAELSEEAGEVILVTTRVLQVAASRGYTLSEIAQFCRRETIAMPSRLELLLAECRTVDVTTLDTALDRRSIEERIDLSFPSRAS